MHYSKAFEAWFEGACLPEDRKQEWAEIWNLLITPGVDVVVAMNKIRAQRSVSASVQDWLRWVALLAAKAFVISFAIGSAGVMVLKAFRVL